MTETKKSDDKLSVTSDLTNKDADTQAQDLSSGLWKAFKEDRQKLLDETQPVLLVMNDKAAAEAGQPNGGADKPAPVKPVEAAKQGEAAQGAAKPLEASPKLEGAEAARAKEVQQNLIGLAPLFVVATREGNKQEVGQLQKGLKDEQDAGVFGPRSKEAFEKYLQWMKRSTLSTIREMDMMQLELPPGCPVKLPSDTLGSGMQRAIDPQFFKALASDDKINFEWNIDHNKVPSELDLNKLDIGFEWLTICNQRVKEAVTEFQVKELTKSIEELHFPEGCKIKPTDDPRAWLQSGLQITDAAARSKNLIEAMHHCYKGSTNNDFPFVLPQGASVTVEYNGKTKTITDKEVNDSDVKYMLKHGKLLSVQLDLPKDFRQEEPHNRQRIDNLMSWMDTNADRVNQTLMGLLRLKDNSDSIVMYGDVEMKNCSARLKEGKLVGLCDPRKYQPQPGETLQEANLIGHNFYVQKTGEGENAKYEIRQTIQAENAPPWAYLNARCFTTEVGGVKEIILKKPMGDGKEEPYGPEDFVPLRNGDKIELIKAKNLESYKRGAQIAYYGEKALIATMDAAMIVSGTIEIGAAVKGLRLAIPMANAALKLTGTEAALQIGKGFVRVGVGGLGVFNNAGARATEWGEQVNLWRGRYFIADISQGLARGTFGLVRKGVGLGKAAEAGQAMSSADKVHSIIHGTKPITSGDIALKGTPYLKELHTGSTIAFRATEYGFFPLLSTDVAHQWDKVRNPGKRDPLNDALIVIGDGRGGMLIKRGEFDPTKKEALEAAGKILDNHAAALKEGRSPSVGPRIDEIMAKTKELMKPEAKVADREAFKKQLLQEMTFTPDQIRDLEKAHPSSSDSSTFALSDKQLKDMLDPAKHASLPRAVRAELDKIIAAKDKDVMAASHLALLYLCRNADGKLEEQLASNTVEVPEYKRTIIVNGPEHSSTYEATIKPRAASITLSTAEEVAALKREVASTDVRNRGVVLGDALVRIGGITHQEYGATLQSVLMDPMASRADKMRALTDANGARLGTIIDALRYQELEDKKKPEGERNLKAGRAFGLGSDALMKQLEETASKDKDADVRAMAAATLFGLRERDVEVRAKFMNAFNQTWQDLGATEGAFSAKVIKFLEKEMTTGIPTDAEPAAKDKVREIRINGALALAHLTDATNKEGQRKVSEALAESMSPTSPMLSLKIMDSLLPERINQLTIDNQNLANSARAVAVELVGKPKNDASEVELIGILERIEPFLQKGEASLKVETSTRLQAMLRNNRTNKDYAGDYPAVREAAINSLAAFGDRTALDVIRSHVAEKATFKVGATEIVASESEASVRGAAIKALERLADPALRQIVMNELLFTETDPNVANKLRDVRHRTDRIEPTSAEYKQMYETAATEVIGWGEKYKYLEAFKDEAPKAWIGEKFPMLIEKTWRDETRSKIDNATSFVGRRFSFDVTINHEEWKAGLAVHKTRQEQWDQLCKMATKGDEEGNKAKIALLYIMTHDGQPLGSGGGLDAGAFKGYYDEGHNHKYYESDWKDAAARQFRYLAENGCEGRDVTTYAIKQGLLYSAQLPGYVSCNLLDGLAKLSKPGKDGTPLPEHELANITARALRAEIDRRQNQTDYYQQFLLEDLKRYNHRTIFPVLEAMKDFSKIDGSKKIAAEMLADFRDSVNMMWDNTKPWQGATPAQRADALKTALDEKNNAEKTVQAIFSAYKDHVIKDATDPALPLLQLTLNESNQRTTMAAAKVLMKSTLPNDHPAKVKAIAILSDIALNGKAPRYKADAGAELATLNITTPIEVQGLNSRFRLEKGTGPVPKITEIK